MAVPAPTPPQSADAIRVLVVDDSAVARGLTKRWLGEEQGVEVVGSAVDGADAVDKAKALQPDIVVLDVEMPVLDGLSALPRILAAAPRTRVVMASTRTQRNAEVTIKALAAGAADFVSKPEATRLGGAQAYRAELVAKIRALCAVGMRPRAAAAARAEPSPAPRPAPTFAQAPVALVIGVSTGGPQALRELVATLASAIPAPILIVQHMPATFTTILAQHLDKLTDAAAVEATHGRVLEPGTIYVAPGGHHMTVARRAGRDVVELDTSPPVNHCRPAVDPLFRSAAALWGAGTLAVVLTGMGSDGCDGARAVVDAGGRVIVQDEATSVVWGMPGAVARAGLAHSILPLSGVGPAVVEAFRRGAS